MKKKNSLYKAAAFLAIVLASTSCTDDANSLEESESQSKFVSITAGMNTTPTTDTRTTYESNIQQDGSASMIIRWEEKEEIAIFRTEGHIDSDWYTDYDILRSDKSGLSDEGRRTVFKGDVTLGTGSPLQYCAMYPLPGEVKEIQMSQYLYKYYNIEMEHTQDCLNPTAHLKKNDIMSCSDLEYPFERGIDFEHRFAILRIAVTIPENKSIKSVTLSAPSLRIFYNRIMVQLESGNGGASIFGEDSSDSFTLNLKNDAADKQVTAYMMMFPRYIRESIPLAVTAVAEDGTSYSKSFNSGADPLIQQGSCYTIKQTLQ